MISVAVFSGSASGQGIDCFAAGEAGIMKVVADAVLRNGGQVAAVVPLETAGKER